MLITVRKVCNTPIMPYGVVRVTLSEVQLNRIIRALENEVRFNEWLLQRTLADQRALSAAEVAVDNGELSALLADLKRPPGIAEELMPQRKIKRLKATG